MSDSPSASPQPDPAASDIEDDARAEARAGGFAPSDASRSADQQALQDLLKSLAYLQQFTSADELGYYLHGIERRRVARGQRIYTQGQRVDRIYLIVTGAVDEVRVRPAALPVDAAGAAALSANALAPASEELLLRRAGSPNLLGLFDLVNGKPHSSSARTATVCDLIVLEAAQVNRLLYRYPELRASMLPAARIDRLRTMPLLAGGDNVAISYVADAATIRTCTPGETIYQAGEGADRIFMIDEGQVRLDYGDLADVRTLWMGNGGDFGYGARPPSAGVVYELEHNAVAVSVVRVLVVPRQTFVAATGIIPEVEGARLRAARTKTLDETGVFQAWSPEERSHLMGFVSHYYLPASNLMTQQGDVADSLWVLLPGGRAVVHTVGPEGVALADVQLAGPGYFNEEALRSLAPATSTLESEPNAHWLRLHWQDFNAFLEQSGRAEMAAQLRLNRKAATVAQAGAQRRYAWLAADERILLEVRRHWIVAMARIAPAVFLSVLFGWLLIMVIGWEATHVLAWVAVAALGLSTLAAWFWGVADYLNDYLLVTNLRVVRQEKVVLFSQKLQAAPLEKIQDVNYRQDVWGSYLGFADLEVQTPGPGGNIRFDRVADFKRVQQAITRERDVRRRYYQATGKKLIYKTLENRFGGALVLPARVLGLALVPAATLPPLTATGGLAWLAKLAGATRRHPMTGKLLTPATNPIAGVPPGGASISATPPVAETGDRRVWHKHWLILVRNATLPMLGLIATTAFAVYVYGAGLSGALIGLALFLAVVCAGWLWWNVEDWSNDIYILDHDQLTDIEQRPLGLQNKVRTAGMRQIVDLRLEVPSPLHYLLNFGHVFVQTAAQDGEFTFLNVRDPAGVMETIRMRLDQSRIDEERMAAKQRAQEFPDWLEVYSRLERRGVPSDAPEYVAPPWDEQGFV